MKKLIAVVAAALLLTGCGASWNAAHDHNAATATNSQFSNQKWFWLKSPGSFQTIIYTCIGKMAIYETQDNSYPFIVHNNDALCGGNGVTTIVP